MNTKHKLTAFKKMAVHAGIMVTQIEDTTVNQRLRDNWQACLRTAKTAVEKYETQLACERMVATVEALWGHPLEVEQDRLAELAEKQLPVVSMGHLRPDQKTAPILALANFPDDPYHNDICDCAHQVCGMFPWNAANSPDRWHYVTHHSGNGATVWQCGDETITVYPYRMDPGVYREPGYF